jgi:uncharacterized protein
MLLSRGDREDYLAGDFTRRTAADWPIPDTAWTALSLSPARSGSARSLNDGSLVKVRPAPRTTQSYLSVPSLPLATDPATIALLGASGLNALTTAIPILTEMTLADLVGLTYTTAPLTDDVASAGPLALRVPLSTSTPGTGIWAVLSDVSPDGVGHPLTAGRLSTDFPGVIESESFKDSDGHIVQPFGDYGTATPAKPGTFRPYQVEFWPVGNVFEKGHRIRVTIVGASAASRPSVPAVNQIGIGSSDGAELLVPALPGSDLAAALPK